VAELLNRARTRETIALRSFESSYLNKIVILGLYGYQDNLLCLYIRSNGEQVFCFSGKRKGKKERGLSSLLFLLAADLTELDNEGFLLTFCCFLGPSYVSIFICIFYLDIFVLGLGFYLFIYIYYLQCSFRKRERSLPLLHVMIHVQNL
jgi:hypothetical protein